MSTRPERYRFAFDIGGTFSDLVLSGSEGSLHTAKVLSDATTVIDPILTGLRTMCREHQIAFESIGDVVVGATTAVTNLVIEAKGARTALITTAGFRDVLEIGRELRYDLYNLLAPGPNPLIPRERRHTVRERIDANGRVLCAPEPEALREVAQALDADRVEAVAVCLLHSYRNPAHELLLAEILRSALPGVHLSLSHQVLGEIREYERSVATVLNAYAMPKVSRYLRSIEEGLRSAGMRADLRVMQSNGGVISRAFGERFPIRLLESGPAAGALGASHSARALGLKHVLAFDMGGTTAKACLVSEGEPGITYDFEAARVQRFKRGSGLPVRLPTVDLIEIGAGGGSIARVDAAGLIKLGPESAGSAPGPASYGLGGERPTVTDAALLLGYLDPHADLSGAVRLRYDLAEKAVLKYLATPLGLSLTEAASGIHRIVCEQMAAAAKVHAVEKGSDIRKSVLLAFGGAGPLHAREVARRLRSPEVIVPSSAGVFSAYGLLVAPMKVDLVRTRFTRLDALVLNEAEDMLRAMEAQLSAELRAAQPDREATGEDRAKIIAKSTIRFVRSADLRYVGQGFELSTPLPPSFAMFEEEQVRNFQGEDPSVRARAAILEAFEEVYARHFGAHLEGAAAEILSWRVEAYLSTSLPAAQEGDTWFPAVVQSLAWEPPGVHAEASSIAAQSLSGSPAALRSRRAFFPCQEQWIDTPVVCEDALEPGRSFVGPALIEQRGSTVVVGPGDGFLRDALGNLRIRVRMAA